MSGRRSVLLGMLLAASTPGMVSDVHAGHDAAPSPVVRAPAAPLRQCRPAHLSAEPSHFRPGDAARRFRVFVEADCGRRSEPVAVEVWYRALYYDTANRVAFGDPQLVGALSTTTALAQGSPHGPGDLKHFEVPAGTFYLHFGCYIGRIRITPAAGIVSADATDARVQEGEVEVCATPPEPSLPGPPSEPLLRWRR